MYDRAESCKTFGSYFLGELCSRSLTDKMLVCGTSAPGSIPGESTSTKKSMRKHALFCLCTRVEISKITTVACLLF